MFHFVLPILFQAVSNFIAGGNPWPEDDDDLIQGIPDSILRAMLLGNMNSWVIAGDYLTRFGQGLVDGKAWGSTGTLPIIEPARTSAYVGAKLRKAIDETRDMSWSDVDRLVGQMLDMATGLPFERTIKLFGSDEAKDLVLTRKAVPVPRSPEQARRQQAALQRQRQRAPLQRQRQQAALQRQRQRAAIPPARSQKTAKIDG